MAPPSSAGSTAESPTVIDPPLPAGRLAEAPRLPDDATAEQREAHWYKYVYQGDRMPQLTFRAIIMGGFLGMLMSISNLYTTLQVGWSFGVAITACVLSFIIWNALRALSGGRLTPMSILENNCMQSTASAAGYSTGSTLATAFGALLLLTGKHVKWYQLAPFILFTALMGTFIAIPMKRQMINIEQLPFPDGTAAAATLTSLYGKGREALRKAYALLAALATGLIVGFFRFAQGLLHWADRIYSSIGHIADLWKFPTQWTGIHRGTLEGFGFEPGVLMIGAGMIMGLRVTLSMLGGSVLLYFVLAPWLLAHNTDPNWGGVVNFKVDPLTGNFAPKSWGLWGGTSLLVLASLTSLALQWRTFSRAFSVLKRRDKTKADMGADIEVPGSWLMMGIIPLGLATVLTEKLAFDIPLHLGTIAVVMSFVIALVCCRATGETNTTPIGPMGKITQLMYAVLAKGNMTVNLMSAGATGGAGMPAADLLTDLKSGYLLGANPRRQFLAQLTGVFFGTVAIVPAWYLMVPDREALQKFALPATNMWMAFAKMLNDGLDSLPTSAKYAIAIGGAIGVVLALIPALWPKSAPYVPSAMGLGLSFAFPFMNSLSFAIGALIVWVWCKIARRHGETYSVPIAAGLIAGESMILAMLAILAALPKAMETMFK